MFNGTAYLDRAAPRLAPAKFLMLAFTCGLFIEPGPGSNCPGRIFWPGWSALASRFLAFCPAFAFARLRALALVMSSSPFQVAWWNLDDPLRRNVKLFDEYLAAEAGAGRLDLPLGSLPQRRALLHSHCHQKAFGIMGDVERALGLVPGLEIEVIESGCCGMAGSFGFEAEHAHSP